MIIGHGIDLVDLKRFDRMPDQRLEKLATRICTESELEEFNKHKYARRYLAKIWACKEAISKAFGTGIRDNVTWKNIQITNNQKGQPLVSFRKPIAGSFCSISISHDKDMLVASAILHYYD